MNRKDSEWEESLPIELKLRLLEAELDRLDSDARWLDQRRQEVVEEMRYYTNILSKARPRRTLRRVK